MHNKLFTLDRLAIRNPSLYKDFKKYVICLREENTYSAAQGLSIWQIKPGKKQCQALKRKFLYFPTRQMSREN